MPICRLYVPLQRKLFSTLFLSFVPQSFLTEADEQMDSLLKLYSKMKQEYQSAVKFFGEDPVKLRVDDFFGAFATFVDDFEVCIMQITQICPIAELCNVCGEGVALRWCVLLTRAVHSYSPPPNICMPCALLEVSICFCEMILGSWLPIVTTGA